MFATRHFYKARCLLHDIQGFCKQTHRLDDVGLLGPDHLHLLLQTYLCFMGSPQDAYEEGSRAQHYTLPNHATASISSGPTAGGAIALRVCSSRPECVSMLSLVLLQGYQLSMFLSAVLRIPANLGLLGRPTRT